MRKIPIDPFLLFAVQKTTVPTFASRTVAVAATKVTSGTSSPCTPIDKKCNFNFFPSPPAYLFASSRIPLPAFA